MHRVAARFALLGALCLLAASPFAHAQLFRAYVASTGDDANPCTLAKPCRLLPAALAAVADGGEIWMLDSANFNTATVDVTKSVTILAIPGAVGSVVSPGGSAISIATDNVHVALRNLVLVRLPGAGTSDGVRMSAGASLTVENCVISGLSNGIRVLNGAKVRIADTAIRRNIRGIVLQGGARAVITRTTIGLNNSAGITVSSSNGLTTRAQVADSTIDSNSEGIEVQAFESGVAQVSVRASQLTGNTVHGGYALADPPSAASLAVADSLVSGNGKGIGALGGSGRAWVSRTSVTHQAGNGLDAPSGVIETAGNNVVRNNGTDTSGLILEFAPQ